MLSKAKLVVQINNFSGNRQENTFSSYFKMEFHKVTQSSLEYKKIHDSIQVRHTEFL